jgi:SAM-dependent methyltransferase
MTHSWSLDELAHAGPEHLDAGYVAGYDRKAGHDPGQDLAVLRELGLGQTSTLIDFGAGTGRLALAAAPICRRVIAVEVSGPMIDQLAGAASNAGASNVEVVQAGFLSYRHQGPPADFAYTRHALHQIPDLWKAVALTRIAQSLRPGGVLFLRDLVYHFDPAELDERIEAWLAAAPPDPTDGWTREELAAHVRSEHSTFSWLLEPMLEKAGFRITTATPSPYPSTFVTYLCVKR